MRVWIEQIHEVHWRVENFCTLLAVDGRAVKLNFYKMDVGECVQNNPNGKNYAPRLNLIQIEYWVLIELSAQETKIAPQSMIFYENQMHYLRIMFDKFFYSNFIVIFIIPLSFTLDL